MAQGDGPEADIPVSDPESDTDEDEEGDRRSVDQKNAENDNEISFGGDNVDGFGVSDSDSGPRESSRDESIQHGGDGEDEYLATDEDISNPANDHGFEDTDAGVPAVQGYGSELLRLPLK
jgi:hypothetical protein